MQNTGRYGRPSATSVISGKPVILISVQREMKWQQLWMSMMGIVDITRKNTRHDRKNFHSKSSSSDRRWMRERHDIISYHGKMVLGLEKNEKLCCESKEEWELWVLFYTWSKQNE